MNVWLADCYATLPADTAEGVACALACVQRRAGPGALVYVVTAGEALAVVDGQVSALLDRLADEGYRTRFVGAACTGLHAAILDFTGAGESAAVVLSLELGRPWQQAALDGIGIGSGAVPGGLDVVECVGCLCLSRERPDGEAAMVLGCELLSQVSGPMATSRLLRDIGGLLGRSAPDVPVVSFEVAATWARSVWRAVGSAFRSRVIDSIETGSGHYLSGKPFLELREYAHHVQRDGLALLTAGGGGRIGYLHVGSPEGIQDGRDAGTMEPPRVDRVPCSLRADLESYRDGIDMDGGQPGEATFVAVRHTLKYADANWRGCRNRIFEWSLDRSSDIRSVS